MYQVLPSFLPSTGSVAANVVIASISIALGAAIVISTIARVAAKKAYKA